MLIDLLYKTTIENLIESLEPNQFKGLTTKIKYLYPNIFTSLKDIQSKLKLNTISECIYLIINNLDNVPKCVGISNKCCGNLKFKSIVEGYFNTCKYCSSLTEDFILKRQETNLDKYGVKYATQNSNILLKIQNTNLKRYGVKNIKQIQKDLKNGR
jgi:hypothetical protein